MDSLFGDVIDDVSLISRFRDTSRRHVAGNDTTVSEY
jgi:hypothetical protein